MEILINLLIMCAKFIPFYVLIAIAYLINKRYPFSDSFTKETGLKNSHINIFTKVAFILVTVIVVFSIVTAPSLVPKNDIVVKPQPVYTEPSKAKIQDLTLQPKQTEEERTKRFEELTNYKED